MMVMFTLNSLAIQPSFEFMNSIMNQSTNPNGCPLPGTFFVSLDYNDFWRNQRAFNLGNEIAVHTVNHVGNEKF